MDWKWDGEWIGNKVIERKRREYDHPESSLDELEVEFTSFL